MVTENPSGSTPATFTLGEPSDIVAVIPYLLGYHPTDTLVVLGLREPAARVRLTFRCDLTPETPGNAAELAERVFRALSTEGCGAALAVAYGPAARATPCMDALRSCAGSAGISLREALRVTDGRYWSYLCPTPACCPAEGIPVDTAGSTVAATAVFSGLTAWRDRDQIRRFLARVEGAQRRRMARATAEAESLGELLRDQDATGGRDAFGAAFRREGVRVAREAVAAACRGEFPHDPDRIAWLGVLLTSVRVRDEAWARIDADTAGAHVHLWRQVLRHVEPEYAAAPGALLAVAAWRGGDRALAEAALDEVAEVAPGYSMAALVRQGLRSGVSLGELGELTPEWLEEVWPVAGTENERAP